MSRRRTVVELTEVHVEPPLVDGAPAAFRRLGLFSTFESAARWVSQRVAGDDYDDHGLGYFTGEELVLDHRRRVCNSVAYGRNGSVRGHVSGGVERPWGGREPSTCAFKPGDVVGLVGIVYRIGVVLGLPPSPDEARRWSDVTLGDDLYLVGVLGEGGSPATNNHEHVSESALFAIDDDVAPETRAALAQRFEGYAG